MRNERLQKTDFGRREIERTPAQPRDAGGGVEAEGVRSGVDRWRRLGEDEQRQRRGGDRSDAAFVDAGRIGGADGGRREIGQKDFEADRGRGRNRPTHGTAQSGQIRGTERGGVQKNESGRTSGGERVGDGGRIRNAADLPALVRRQGTAESGLVASGETAKKYEAQAHGTEPPSCDGFGNGEGFRKEKPRNRTPRPKKTSFPPSGIASGPKAEQASDKAGSGSTPK